MNKIYNFSAGPSMLPKEVMIEAQNNFLNWNNYSYSMMEISHRSQNFLNMVEQTEENLRILLNVPKNYKILFSQGGARGQFSVIPMNLLNKNDIADYICSGYWSSSASKEAEKYCIVNKINVVKKIDNKKIVIPMKEWKTNPNSNYIHYCQNETISGIFIPEEPKFINKHIICDLSSCILSQSIKIENYSLIYASAQKNIGPSGITLIIIKEDLIKQSKQNTPSILDYKILLTHDSMFNTPPTFSWYLCGLVFKWLKKNGGIKEIEKINKKKAYLLYSLIDNSDFYINDIHCDNRSIMNIVFRLIDPSLELLFLTESTNFGLLFLKNHKILGGIRASIYNSMPIDGIYALIKFMIYFEKRYG
ncbi:Phosphoserine aminotransferase [Buchnera aphidicola (Eriosoma grossulariae)]|uniref:3-phosphoserine/phosphohydroxythreonine transaminase n=1 Tax=Buchnera aphidicola TaxID=9 RepID=UPI0034647B62